MLRFLCVALLAGTFAVGCSSDNNNNPPPPPADSGVPDSGVPDSGVPDSGVPDSGVPDAGAPDAGPFVLTITNFTFSPADFTVDAGTTIEVMNNAGFAHTVTSEAADNDFTPAAVNGVSFDVSVPGDGTATFTIPAGATSGTVIPYYCKIHTGSMTPPNGHITVH